MSTHLSHEEMTRALMNDPPPTVTAHLHECEVCQKEFDELGESLILFRAASQNWTANALANPVHQTFRASKPSHHGFRWAGAAAVMILLAAGSTLYVSHRPIDRPAIVKVASTETSVKTQIEQDNELLSQVNREISEGVPAPMQPLQLSESNAASSPKNQAR